MRTWHGNPGILALFGSSRSGQSYWKVGTIMQSNNNKGNRLVEIAIMIFFEILGKLMNKEPFDYAFNKAQI